MVQGFSGTFGRAWRYMARVQNSPQSLNAVRFIAQRDH